MEFDELSKKVLDAAMMVHLELGPGLFEETYKVYQIKGDFRETGSKKRCSFQGARKLLHFLI